MLRYAVHPADTRAFERRDRNVADLAATCAVGGPVGIEECAQRRARSAVNTAITLDLEEWRGSTCGRRFVHRRARHAAGPAI